MALDGMKDTGPQPVCAQEALNLLNCVTDSSYDQERCLRLLNSLRECVLKKKVKKFSLDVPNQPEAESESDSKGKQ